MSSLKSDILIAPSEIFSSSSTQGTDIGARATTGDGRVFRYVSCGSTTAVVVGKVYQSPAQDAGNFQNLSIAAAGTNTYIVTTTSTVTLLANQLVGGLLTVRSGSGQGYSYKIKSHPAATAGTVAITLEDPLQIALASTSVIDITPNPYSGILLNPVTPTGVPVGVSVYPIPAGYYGWIQTKGLGLCYSDKVVEVGKGATSSGTTGNLTATSGTLTVYATAAITTTDLKYAPFFLNFE